MRFTILKQHTSRASKPARLALISSLFAFGALLANGNAHPQANKFTLAKATTTPPSQPKALAQNVATSEDSAKAITLVGTGAKGSELTYQIVTLPAHGALSGTGATRTYLPSVNYNGSDKFTFRVSDGINSSAAATVEITVTAVNDPPIQIAGGTNTTTSVGITGFALMFSSLQMSPGGGLDEASQTLTCRFVSLPPSTHSVIYLANKVSPVTIGAPYTWSQFKSLFLKKAQTASDGSYTRHFQCSDSLGASSADIAYTVVTVNVN